MTKFFNAICDFLWVLSAFLRGKLLRQKAYRPQGIFFRLPVPVTAKRIIMLLKWWGMRPMGIHEAHALWEQMSKQKDDSGCVPVLKWRTNGWELEESRDDWDNLNDCHIFTRK